MEDDPELAESLREILEAQGFQVTTEPNGIRGHDAFCRGRFDIVLTDFRLPEMGGIELLEAIRAHSPRTPVILMTAHSTSDLAIEATQKGAFDYLIKPFRTRELLETLDRAARNSRMKAVRFETGASGELGKRDVMIGQSPRMLEVYQEIGRVADKAVSVLIQGETGTGKELVARALFQHSRRCDGPFIAVNCTAIPESLLESELFGHEKGAFTGALARRIGRFEQAHGGTLFLDEIGDMTPETQVKMLRLLEDRSFRRIGGSEEIRVDVRILAATHRNLEEGVAGGWFREDLYYRIHTTAIDLPALRDREGDIERLMEHFLVRYCEEYGADRPKMDRGTIDLLLRHPWPGNVRELENVARKIVLKSGGYPVTAAQVEEWLARSLSGCSLAPDERHLTHQRAYIREVLGRARKGEVDKPYALLIEGLERVLISEALEIEGGNQTAACRLLGLSRVTFREKMGKYGLLPRKS